MKNLSTKLLPIGIILLLLPLLISLLDDFFLGSYYESETFDTFFPIIFWISIILGIGLIYFGITGKHKVIADNINDSVEASRNASIQRKKKYSNRKECDLQLDDFIASCGGVGRLIITNEEIYFIKKDDEKEKRFNAPKRGFVLSEEYADHVAKRLGWDIKKYYDNSDAGLTQIHASDLADKLGLTPSISLRDESFSYAILTPKDLLEEEKREQRKQRYIDAINYKGV